MQPYFQAVYQDLLIRSSPTKEVKALLVDKVTLVEYVSLPGILSERFFALVSNNDKKDPRVSSDRFCNVMQKLYCSQIDEKMQIAFNIYDFDCDGKISAEDVRLVLNYIPMNFANNSDSEGLYQNIEGRDINDTEREQNQQNVANFVKLAFEHRPIFNLKEFIEFNTAVSSEMFLLIISTLQKRLPCT